MSSIRITGNWIFGPKQDFLFILLPPLFVTSLVFLFPGFFQASGDVSPWAWLLLVVGIDVAHVYSTLYRTYFDKATFRTHKTVLLLIPLTVFVAGVIIYSMGPGVFWRLAAYLAVFHFIRQQYGFARIYSRKENRSPWSRRIDAVTIYLLTLYPIAHWHLTGPHSFNWFVSGDFFYFHSPALLTTLKIIYWSFVALFCGKEVYESVRYREFNISKFMLFAGTGVSWYVGIITFDGDLVFTLLNVVSHGIPYMALVWFTGNKKTKSEIKTTPSLLQRLFTIRYLLVFLGILLLFAFAEEMLWDGLVWKEHPEFFGFFSSVIPEQLSLDLLIVPLLCIPQFTHYVIDGFIWKMRSDQYDWSKKTLS